jgi:hypothetical protein
LQYQKQKIKDTIQPIGNRKIHKTIETKLDIQQILAPFSP